MIKQYTTQYDIMNKTAAHNKQRNIKSNIKP